MYSYCNSYANSDYIPGKGETTDVINTIQVTIKIDQAQPVINIVAGQTFDVTNIGPPTVGAGPWSYTQANIGYFKRLKPGAAMLITEDASTITIGAKQLTADLDLYVANGNPDISPDFSTIQNALNYLGQYLIPTTIQARIWVQPGTYNLSTAIGVTHPNAQNITIQGPKNTTLRATSASAITGSAYNWNVTFAGIANTSTIGSWVIVNNIYGSVANTLPLITGFFQVASKTASTVTVRVPWRGSSFAIPTVSQVDITPITAILNVALNNSGVLCESAGLGLFQYIGIVPQATPTASCHAFSTVGKATLNYVGVFGFNVIMDVATNKMCFAIVAGTAVGYVICSNCATTNNTHGFVGSTGGNVSMYSCASTHNSSWGAWLDAGGSCFFAYGITFLAGNGNFGMVIGSGTNVIVVSTYPNRGNVWCYWNGFYGCYVAGGASLQIQQYCSMRYWGNNTYDFAADTFGLYSGYDLSFDSRAMNQPLGQLSSRGALIV
jgi:hypothetical protein